MNDDEGHLLPNPNLVVAAAEVSATQVCERQPAASDA
jgi:hypothetical protein